MFRKTKNRDRKIISEKRSFLKKSSFPVPAKITFLSVFVQMKIGNLFLMARLIVSYFLSEKGESIIERDMLERECEREARERRRERGRHVDRGRERMRVNVRKRFKLKE